MFRHNASLSADALFHGKKLSGSEEMFIRKISFPLCAALHEKKADAIPKKIAAKKILEIAPMLAQNCEKVNANHFLIDGKDLQKILRNIRERFF